MKVHEVNVAKFKAHMGKYLRSVRRGKELIVLDRETPVARIVPYLEDVPLQYEVREPLIPFRDVLKRKRFRKKVSVDSLTFLLEERGSR